MKKALGRKPSFAIFFFLCLFAASAAFSSGGRDKNFDIAAGNLKATLYRKTGTFTFHKLRDGGKSRYDPLLDTRKHGASTRFAVSVNGSIYVLEKKTFEAIGFEASDDGREASFLFAHPDGFEVRQRFYIEENSVFGQRALALAIETAIENTSAGPLEVAWRALLDTELGEGSSRTSGHFVTDGGQEINVETLISRLDPEPRFLFSSNGERTLAISLEGAETVYAARRSRCDNALRASFGPVDRVEGRRLRTGDSAVLICWPSFELQGGESASVTLFLSAVDAQDVAANAPAAGALTEKRALYFMISDRLRQIESGEVSPSMSEIDELNSILDFLLDGFE